MSRLRSNPIREVPKRVFIISLIVTGLIIVVTLFFNWPTVIALIGFWMGVGINLVNFRIIVIGSKNFLEKAEAGKKASMTPNIVLRFLLYGLVFIIAWRIGIPALLASFIGAYMVNFAFKTDGFFTLGFEKKESTDLRKRANVDGVYDIEKESIKGIDDTEEVDEPVKVEEVEEVEEADVPEEAEDTEDEIEVYL